MFTISPFLILKIRIILNTQNQKQSNIFPRVSSITKLVKICKNVRTGQR